MTALQEPLTSRLRRGAHFVESTLGDPVVGWSLESRESLVDLLNTAAEALEQRDDAAELRAALEGIVQLLTKPKSDPLRGAARVVGAIGIARAALAASEGAGALFTAEEATCSECGGPATKVSIATAPPICANCYHVNRRKAAASEGKGGS